MVKVIERYKFAGDEVIKERLLPADHPDAVAYLKRAGTITHQDAAVGTSTSETAQPNQTSFLSSSASPATSSAPAPPTAAASRPPPPGPRRKKQSKLASLAASSDAPKQMNTLEKSKMDWEGWKKGGAATAGPAGASGSGGGGDAKGLDGLTDREREEMEQQTKTGSGSGSMAGYLGRSDFLERVKERTEGQ